MRAREVSVGIQESHGELIVIVRLKVKSPGLEREPAHPEPAKTSAETLALVGTRVRESARKRKEKEIQRVLEAVEFPND
jgi:hypothetical protein